MDNYIIGEAKRAFSVCEKRLKIILSFINRNRMRPRDDVENFRMTEIIEIIRTPSTSFSSTKSTQTETIPQNNSDDPTDINVETQSEASIVTNCQLTISKSEPKAKEERIDSNISTDLLVEGESPTNIKNDESPTQQTEEQEMCTVDSTEEPSILREENRDVSRERCKENETLACLQEATDAKEEEMCTVSYSEKLSISLDEEPDDSFEENESLLCLQNVTDTEKQNVCSASSPEKSALSKDKAIYESTDSFEENESLCLQNAEETEKEEKFCDEIMLLNSSPANEMPAVVEDEKITSRDIFDESERPHSLEEELEQKKVELETPVADWLQIMRRCEAQYEFLKSTLEEEQSTLDENEAHVAQYSFEGDVREEGVRIIEGYEIEKFCFFRGHKKSTLEVIGEIDETPYEIVDPQEDSKQTSGQSLVSSSESGKGNKSELGDRKESPKNFVENLEENDISTNSNSNMDNTRDQEEDTCEDIPISNSYSSTEMETLTANPSTDGQFENIFCDIEDLRKDQLPERKQLVKQPNIESQSQSFSDSCQGNCELKEVSTNLIEGTTIIVENSEGNDSSTNESIDQKENILESLSMESSPTAEIEILATNDRIETDDTSSEMETSQGYSKQANIGSQLLGISSDLIRENSNELEESNSLNLESIDLPMNSSSTSEIEILPKNISKEIDVTSFEKGISEEDYELANIGSQLLVPFSNLIQNNSLELKNDSLKILESIDQNWDVSETVPLSMKLFSEVGILSENAIIKFDNGSSVMETSHGDSQQVNIGSDLLGSSSDLSQENYSELEENDSSINLESIDQKEDILHTVPLPMESSSTSEIEILAENSGVEIDVTSFEIRISQEDIKQADIDSQSLVPFPDFIQENNSGLEENDCSINVESIDQKKDILENVPLPMESSSTSEIEILANNASIEIDVTSFEMEISQEDIQQTNIDSQSPVPSSDLIQENNSELKEYDCSINLESIDHKEDILETVPLPMESSSTSEIEILSKNASIEIDVTSFEMRISQEGIKQANIDSQSLVSSSDLIQENNSGLKENDCSINLKSIDPKKDISETVPLPMESSSTSEIEILAKNASIEIDVTSSGMEMSQEDIKRANIDSQSLLPSSDLIQESSIELEVKSTESLETHMENFEENDSSKKIDKIDGKEDTFKSVPLAIELSSNSETETLFINAKTEFDDGSSDIIEVEQELSKQVNNDSELLEPPADLTQENVDELEGITIPTEGLKTMVNKPNFKSSTLQPKGSTNKLPRKRRASEVSDVVHELIMDKYREKWRRVEERRQNRKLSGNRRDSIGSFEREDNAEQVFQGSFSVLDLTYVVADDSWEVAGSNRNSNELGAGPKPNENSLDCAGTSSTTFVFDQNQFLTEALGEDLMNITCTSAESEQQRIGPNHSTPSRPHQSSVTAAPGASCAGGFYNTIRKSKSNLVNAVHVNPVEEQLMKELIVQKETIHQVSKVLAMCRSQSKHVEQDIHVEAERILRIATCRQELIDAKLKQVMPDHTDDSRDTSMAITIKNINFSRAILLANNDHCKQYSWFFMCVLESGTTVLATKAIKPEANEILFPDTFEFKGKPSELDITVKLYAMALKNPKKKKKIKLAKALNRSISSPCVTPTHSFFILWGKTQIKPAGIQQRCGRSCFRLMQIPPEALLSNIFSANVELELQTAAVKKGFLTVGKEEVNRLPTWQRRWCVLNGSKLKYWNDPSDELIKEPVGQLDLIDAYCDRVHVVVKDFFPRAWTLSLLMHVEGFKQPVREYFFTTDTPGEMEDWRTQFNLVLSYLVECGVASTAAKKN